MFRLRVLSPLLLSPLLVACPQTPVPEPVSVSSDPRVLNGTYTGHLSLDGERVQVTGQSAATVYLTRSGLPRGASMLSAYDAQNGTLLNATDLGTDETYFYRPDDRLVRVRPGMAEVLDAASRQPLNRYEIGAGFTASTGLYGGGELVLKRPLASPAETVILSTVNGRLTSVPAGLGAPVTDTLPDGSMASGDLAWWQGASSTLTNIQTLASVSAVSHHGNPCWYFNNPVSSRVSRSGRLFLSFPDGRIEVLTQDGRLETTLIASECQVVSPNLQLESRPEGVRIVSLDHPTRFALLDPATLELRWTEAAPPAARTGPYGVPEYGDDRLLTWHAADGQVLWTLPRTALPLRLDVKATLDDSPTARPEDYRVKGRLELPGRRLDLDGTVRGQSVIIAQFSPLPPPGFYLRATLTENGSTVGELNGQKFLSDRSAEQQLSLRLDGGQETYSGVVKP